MPGINRREFIAAGAALGASTALAEERSMLTRPIPSTGAALPVIGLGTYGVFDVEGTPAEIADRRVILDALSSVGGGVIDTSPMYNRSERIIGDVIAAGGDRADYFLATKVWTTGRDAGIDQMRDSARLMRTDVIDLMQVHNLRDTETHMATIREFQQDGLIRYNGLTHYRASALDELESEMLTIKPDFIQINYSLAEREAERRVLPIAQDEGIAVIINRPFQSGDLFRAVRGRDVPGWASEFAASWGQFFLKFIVSHPAVTCAIPATSKPHHMRDNLEAGFGPLPDAATRERMVEFMGTM